MCGSFTRAIEHLTQQAQKALFKLKQVGTQHNIITSLKLFDSLIMPIIRYCSEVWSPYLTKGLNLHNILSLCDKLPAEKLHTKFCRFLLSVNRKATNAAVRAELGRRSLLTDLITHSIKYWINLCKSTPGSLVKKAYLESHSLGNSNVPSWAFFTKQICFNFDMSETWFNQGTLYINKTVKILRTNMYQVYDINWRQYMEREHSKLRTYKTFKSEIYLENYLLALTNPKSRQEFTKLRISAHKLNIELGRYTRPITPVEDRKCVCCNSIENELHMIMDCSLFNTERKLLFDQLELLTDFSSLTQSEKFIFIMSYNNGDLEVLDYVVNFVNRAVEIRTAHYEL